MEYSFLRRTDLKFISPYECSCGFRIWASPGDSKDKVARAMMKNHLQWHKDGEPNHPIDFEKLKWATTSQLLDRITRGEVLGLVYDDTRKTTDGRYGYPPV